MGYTTPYHNPKYEILQKKTIHLRLIPCSMLSLSWPHWDHLPRCGTGTPKDTVRAAKNIAWTDEKTMKRGTVAYQEEEQPHVGLFSQEWRCCLVCLYLIPQWLAGLEQYHCNVQTGWTNRVLDGLSNVCLCDSPNVERSFTFVSIISLDFEVLLLNRERKWPRNYKIDRGPVEVRGVVHCCS